MVYNPEGFTDNSPMLSRPYVPVKQLSARKSLHQCSETLDVKPNTDFHRLCDDKSKRKAIRPGIILWPIIQK